MLPTINKWFNFYRRSGTLNCAWKPVFQRHVSLFLVILVNLTLLEKLDFEVEWFFCKSDMSSAMPVNLPFEATWFNFSFESSEWGVQFVFNTSEPILIVNGGSSALPVNLRTQGIFIQFEKRLRQFQLSSKFALGPIVGTDIPCNSKSTQLHGSGLRNGKLLYGFALLVEYHIYTIFENIHGILDTVPISIYINKVDFKWNCFFTLHGISHPLSGWTCTPITESWIRQY